MHKNLKNHINFNNITKLIASAPLALCCFAYTALADSPAVPAGSEAPAQVVGGAAQGMPPQPGFGSMLMPFALMFGVIYFLMIRPQQKKMKEHEKMLSALAHGDEVVTASGMLGKVTGITDKVLTIEIAANVRVKMLKSQISQVLKGQAGDLA